MGAQVPWAQLARISLTPGPSMIRDEGGRALRRGTLKVSGDGHLMASNEEVVTQVREAEGVRHA